MIIINKKNFKKNIVDLNISIQDSIRLLQNLEQDIIFVTKENKLFGSITDNDLRNYYLKLKNLKKNENNIINLVNQKTFYLYKTQFKKYKKSYIKKKIEKYRFIPLLNKKKEIVELMVSDDRANNLSTSNKINAIIMAGGYGSRLRPITHKVPKPIIVINENSNLISLMNNLKKANINNFFITTHYLSNLIKKEIDMFWFEKNKINFYYEKKLLGTFGSVIALIKKYKFKEPLIVCNSDIVTNLNFSNLIKYFFNNKCKFLVCNKILKNHIPYGVIVPNKNKKIIKTFYEKPSDYKLINAGIYMVDPKTIIKYFPKTKKLSIVEVIEKLIKLKVKCHIFPIDEFWSDMGSHKELELLRESGKV